LEDNESTFTSRVSGLIRSKLKAKTGATEKNIRKIAKEVASKNGVTPGKVKPIIVSLLSQFREAALDQVASPVDDVEAPLIPDAVARLMCILSVGDVKRRDRAQVKAAEAVKVDVTALQEGLAAVREELAAAKASVRTLTGDLKAAQATWEVNLHIPVMYCYSWLLV
jgi:hypothetical protein